MGGFRRKFRHGSERATADGEQGIRESLEPPVTPTFLQRDVPQFAHGSKVQTSSDCDCAAAPMSVACDGAVASCSATVAGPHRSPARNPSDSLSRQHSSLKANGTRNVAAQFAPYPSAKKCNGCVAKPLYDVFLGGSCGNTVWRRDQVIPYLEKRAITYYDPQRSVWNEHMINEESVAKENSNLFLFVLDPATVNATSFLEIAHFAARKAPKLVVVFLGRSEWRDKGHAEDLPDRRRTCDLLDCILTLHNVPVLQSVQEALSYIDEQIIGEKSWSEAMANPFQRLPYMMLKGRRVLQESANHVKGAWRTVKSGITRWRGTKYVLVGACEVLLVLAVHFFLHSIPLFLVLLPLIAVDAVVSICCLVYYHYKTMSVAKRRATLLQQRALTKSAPVAIPGRAIVPCDIVAQQMPLNCCCKSTNGLARESISSQLFKTRSYDSNGVANPLRWTCNGSVDIFLCCSAKSPVDVEWMTHSVAPQLHKKGLTFATDLMVERHKRLSALDSSRQILYHISSSETMLSGMVEVAYFLGHSNWHVTLCVPKRAKMLSTAAGGEVDEQARQHIERRRECYRMAFCYLRDMAERRRCEVFSHLDDAVQYVISCSKE